MHKHITYTSSGCWSFKEGKLFFLLLFFKPDCQVVKRARTRCRVDGLYFIDKKNKKQKNKGNKLGAKKAGNERGQVTNNQETRWESTQ